MVNYNILIMIYHLLPFFTDKIQKVNSVFMLPLNTKMANHFNK